MKVTLILALILFPLLMACGKFQRAENYYYNEAFKIEVQEYMLQKQSAYGDSRAFYNISIDFAFLIPPTVGTCHTRVEHNVDGNYVYKEIVIDPIFWHLASNPSREQLIFHELGHCDLSLKHTDHLSIMSDKVMSSFLYESNRDQFIFELFHGTPKVTENYTE